MPALCLPVWFAWFEKKVYVCVPGNSVKAWNFTQNPRMALSLEDGVHPIIWDYAADGD